MELQSYFEILWRRKWIVLLIALLMTGIAAGFNYLTPPTYTSATTLRVATLGGTIDAARADLNYADRLMNTYTTIATSGSTRSEVVKQLGLEEQPVLSAAQVRGTELLRIQADASKPKVAQQAADAAASVLIRRSREQFSGGGQSSLDTLRQQVSLLEAELTQQRADYENLLNQSPGNTVKLNAAQQSIQLKQNTYESLLGQYEKTRIDEALRANAVNVFEPATLPQRPSAPRTSVNLILGMLAGLVGGVILAFLREALDGTLRTTQQIETVAQSPAIGEIPLAKGNLQLLHSSNGHRPQIEAFRRLRVNILAPTAEEPTARTILVTSAERGAGKTTVTANLAVTISQSGRRVIVVDCDLHKPALQTLFSVSNDKGLTTVLSGQTSVTGATQETKYPRLTVLTSGPLLADADAQFAMQVIAPAGLSDHLSQGIELLGSPKMATILRQLKQEYDVVLLDTPAMLDVTDAAVLAPLVDEVVLVATPNGSRRDNLRTVRQQLENVHAKTVDVVVNRA